MGELRPRLDGIESQALHWHRAARYCLYAFTQSTVRRWAESRFEVSRSDAKMCRHLNFKVRLRPGDWRGRYEIS